MRMTPNGGVLSDGKPPQSADVRPGMASSASIPLARPMMYNKGGKVKKTGWAIVHKGEEIKVAEDKKKKKKSGKKGGAKKHVHTMHIKHAENGGWIATHDVDKPEGPDGMGGGGTSQEDHIIPAGDDNLANHVTDHMGQDQQEEPQGPAAPAQGLNGPGPGAAQVGGGM